MISAEAMMIYETVAIDVVTQLLYMFANAVG